MQHYLSHLLFGAHQEETKQVAGFVSRYYPRSFGSGACPSRLLLLNHPAHDVWKVNLSGCGLDIETPAQQLSTAWVSTLCLQLRLCALGHSCFLSEGSSARAF